jgi:DNA-binding transcriptional LysR family regulator
MKQGLAGVLRIGAGPVWITTFLPPVIAAFNKQFPRVKVKLTSGVINTLVPELLSGEIDVLCANLDFAAQPEIVKEPLVAIHHSVVARAKHPLSGRGTVSAADLAKYSWLVLANDHVGTNRVGSYFVANALEPPTIAVETTAFGIIKLLLEGDFVAHFPSAMLSDAERFGLVAIPHEGTFWDSQAGIAYRQTSRPLRMVESFKAILRASLAAAR